MKAHKKQQFIRRHFCPQQKQFGKAKVTGQRQHKCHARGRKSRG